MAYVVGEACIKCKYTDCVAVCPVDCFYEGANSVVINPDECIHCGACEPECPTNAIYDEDDLPAKWVAFKDLNALFSGTKGPGDVDRAGFPKAVLKVLDNGTFKTPKRPRWKAQTPPPRSKRSSKTSIPPARPDSRPARPTTRRQVQNPAGEAGAFSRRRSRLPRRPRLWAACRRPIGPDSLRAVEPAGGRKSCRAARASQGAGKPCRGPQG